MKRSDFGISRAFERFEMVFLLILLIAGSFIFINSVLATSSGSSNKANLTIFDEIDQNGNLVRISNQQYTFYANFTNSSNSIINQTNGNGNCTIEFNFTGTFTSPVNMTFNSTLFWAYNRTFNYKGTQMFRANCTSTFGNVTLNDTYLVTNSVPVINLTSGGSFIDIDGNPSTNDRYSCTEDTLCIYNFTNNASDIDLNDVLTYNFSLGANTTLTNFSLNSSTGILAVSVNTSAQTGLKQVELNLRDTESTLQPGILRINITDVNDAPNFTNLAGQSFNISQSFNYTVFAADEEDNLPFTFNITFLNCTVAEWSSRNCSSAAGRSLFNSSQYVFNGTLGTINITFTPLKNDVGNYTINFTVTDLNNVSNPNNASTSAVVNFQVLNVNSLPYFRYLCTNERNASEDSFFSCIVNASDIDEISNLTITANETWFIFNESGSNIANKSVNLATSYNATFIVNFTANDSMVGNWSLNISIRDTANPAGINSTVINFSIANVNDRAGMHNIPNVTAYTSGNSSTTYTLYANASDNDLLIPDKTAYNESLIFSVNVSWVNVSVDRVVSGTNITQAKIIITASPSFIGTNFVNLSVNDLNNFSVSSRVFKVTILNNDAPFWNSNTGTNLSLIEDVNFYLNLSTNVTDPNGDSLNFSFTNSTPFSSFSINTTTGIINFTPTDDDVGYHLISINVTDGNLGASLNFNFTVSNVNDLPSIRLPFSSSDMQNASVDANSNINATEDNATLIAFFAEDNDFKIPIGQKSFYNESLSLNYTVQGPNSLLVVFIKDSAFPTLSGSGANRTRFYASFTPNKTDAGSYNVSLNVTDINNVSTAFRFNLTILAVEHSPVLGLINNQTYSILETFYLDANANDTEDGNESTLNLTYQIRNLTFGGNFLTINRTTGIINATLNQSVAGIWAFNLSVNDSSGRVAFQIFNLTVYDYPVILSPLSNFSFNLAENYSFAFNFSVNHTALDLLNYSLYINNVLKNQTSSGNGNGTSFIWNYTSNFDEETTCSGVVKVNLSVSNQKLGNNSAWNITINHTDYALSFISTIGGLDSKIEGNNSISINLNDFFTDYDASDLCNNQTIGFNYSLLGLSGGSVSVSISNWTNGSTPSATFSASSSASANYTITGFEYNISNSSQLLRNVTSNNFTVEINIASSPSSASSSSGGGGGSSTLVAFKIITPGPLSSDGRNVILVPLFLQNNGNTNLLGITLSGDVSKNGTYAPGVRLSFDKSQFARLDAGARENATLTVYLDKEADGVYEINLRANVDSPAYEDSAKIYFRVGDDAINKKFIFVDQLIIDNPECGEVRELVNEARRLYDNLQYQEANKVIDDAIEACRKSVSQKPASKLASVLRQTNIVLFNYAGIASLVAFILGVSYYFYRRWRIRRTMMGLEPADSA